MFTFPREHFCRDRQASNQILIRGKRKIFSNYDLFLHLKMKWLILWLLISLLKTRRREASSVKDKVAYGWADTAVPDSFSDDVSNHVHIFRVPDERTFETLENAFRDHGSHSNVAC